MTAHFDLNVERVLEHWEPHHALREVIANALDEQSLTGTPDIEISRDAEGHWHVRDYGRGLRIEHFTQNESDEKPRAPGTVIGKFGVGLKDALATFDRHRIGVEIRSSGGTFRVRVPPSTGSTTSRLFTWSTTPPPCTSRART